MLIMLLITSFLCGLHHDIYCSGEKRPYATEKVLGRKKRVFVPNSSKTSSQKNNQISRASSQLINSDNITPPQTSLLVHQLYPKLMNEKPYNPIKTKNLYHPSKPYKISPSQLLLSVKCQSCYYKKHKLGIKDEDSAYATIHGHIHRLQIKESDEHRKNQTPLPVFVDYKLGHLLPSNHPHMKEWQKTPHGGLKHQIPGTNFIATGAVNDMVINQQTGEVHIVDNMSTSTSKEITLDDDAKQRMEVCQYLARKNGLNVSPIGYFPYNNTVKDAEGFHKNLRFTTTLLSHTGNSDWVEPALMAAHQTLQLDKTPPLNPSCAHCQTIKAAANAHK